MKLSISNIAWKIQEDAEINEVLDDLSIFSLEVAPTKIWTKPFDQEKIEINRYRRYWNDKNREIVALQSLLFNQPNLTIFEDDEKRKVTYEYLVNMIKLGAELGAKTFVFGSPKNRIKGDMSLTKALDIAIPFFYNLGEVALKHDTTFCIEPNPIAYGCDFICNTLEGIELVKEVNHLGFRLHLDAAAMTLNEEIIETSLQNAISYMAHFHISEPYLGQVGHGKVDHQRIASQLKQLNYEHYVSIEMKEGLSQSNLKTVKDSLQYVRNIYFEQTGEGMLKNEY